MEKMSKMAPIIVTFGCKIKMSCNEKLKKNSWEESSMEMQFYFAPRRIAIWRFYFAPMTKCGVSKNWNYVNAQSNVKKVMEMQI